MTKFRTNLGKVATIPKGEYSSEITYTRLDIVSYNGSSYVCLQESVGNLPTNTTYWQLIAQKGDTGNDGHTPVKGTDYFTPEDIENLNIPSATSDITNDSGFITNSVNNLVNYYLKNEVYTKEEVVQLIGAIQQFHYERVQELPQTGANNIMYLVPKSTSQTSNYYDEYVYSNGWEKIGDTEIDLSNYVTITMLNQALADYTNTTNLTTLLNEKQNQITSTNKLDASLVDDSLSTNKFVTSAEKTTWNGKQDVLTAGDNITIENNVISATGGGGSSNDDIYVFNIGDFHVQNERSYWNDSSTYQLYFTTLVSDVLQKINDGVTNMTLLVNRLIFNGNGYTYAFTLGGYLSGSRMVFNGYTFVSNYGYCQIIIQISGTSTSNNISFRYVKTPLLSSENTDTYTVTNNYNPAHKKYVDDSISNAVGNINTLLASLTTVEEEQ